MRLMPVAPAVAVRPRKAPLKTMGCGDVRKTRAPSANHRLPVCHGLGPIGRSSSYGRFLHCPLFRAICGAWAAKGRPPPEVPSWAARRRPQGGFHALHLGHPPACAPAFSLRGSDAAGDCDVGLDGVMKHAPGMGLVRRQGRAGPSNANGWARSRFGSEGRVHPTGNVQPPPPTHCCVYRGGTVRLGAVKNW